MQPNSNEKLMGYLAYILFFIPLIAGSKSPFVRYHVNQSLVLLIASIMLQVVVSVFAAIPGIGIIIGLLSFVPLIFFIIGLINVSKGEMKPLPVIGGIRLI